jgi:dTDP-4-dehydrorhamnose 3,5-epimerase-like enzyme
MGMQSVEIIKIRTISDDDPDYGRLSFVEAEKDIPFPIKRIYYIYRTGQGYHRGFHAHKHNWQLLFCPFGSIDIIVDDSKMRETITLDHPSKGLILHPGIGREMVWNQSDSVLCVAASEEYDPNDYIRDYREFMTFAKERAENSARMLKFPEYTENLRGGVETLVEVSGLQDIPFEIKRIFYIHGIKDKTLVRGKHANRKSEFVLFNILGSSKVKVIGPGGEETTHTLDKPTTGLYLPRMVWKEMYDFSENSVMMVLSSEYYDKNEYIRDFDELKRSVLQNYEC